MHMGLQNNSKGPTSTTCSALSAIIITSRSEGVWVIKRMVWIKVSVIISSSGTLFFIVIVDHTIIMAGVSNTGISAAHLCVVFVLLQWSAVSQINLSFNAQKKKNCCINIFLCGLEKLFIVEYLPFCW